MVANRRAKLTGASLVLAGLLAHGTAPANAQTPGGKSAPGSETEIALALPGEESTAGGSERIEGWSGDKPAQSTGSGRLAHPLARIRAVKFAEIIARPLFSSTRRPVPKLRPIVRRKLPKRVVPPAPVSMTLLGVLQSSDRTTIAIIAENTSGASYRVRSGDVVRGWKISRIQQRQMALQKAKRMVTLSLANH